MTNNLSFASLVLGLIGTITGIIALFIHFWKLRKENPRIKVEVLKCEHDFEEKRNQVSFWAKFQIRNLGDRGTSINDVNLAFVSDDQEHCLKKRYFRGRREHSQRRWINPHETIDLEVDFYEKYQGQVKERINCTFSIFHTHRVETVEAISGKRKVVIEET